MERSIAIKKIEKLLGKSFGYTIDPKAADADERAEARAKVKAATDEHSALLKQREARLQELLTGDAEYQRLQTACKEARKHRDHLLSIASHYRFTVGKTVGGMFFSVKAQGDSWEEVIRKLTEKQVAT